MFDVDDVSEARRKRFLSVLEPLTEIVRWLKTPNGYHVVREAFDYNELETDIDHERKTDRMLFVEYLSVVDDDTAGDTDR